MKKFKIYLTERLDHAEMGEMIGPTGCRINSYDRDLMCITVQALHDDVNVKSIKQAIHRDYIDSLGSVESAFG